MPEKIETPIRPRDIEWSGRFTRDYKRENKGRYRATLDGDLATVLEALTNRRPLEKRHNEHPLKGEWKDYRDCHLRPDLLLIYRISETDVLQIARLGSHAELFGS